MGARRGPDGLTDKERRICLAVAEGLTDKDAFRQACPHSKATDYSASVGAARVRKRPHCVAFLKKLQGDTLKSHAEARNRIVAELSNIAFADLGDIVEWGPAGIRIKDSDTLTQAQRRRVAKVTEMSKAHGGRMRLEVHDKIRALDKLCRMFGLYAPDPRSIEAKERYQEGTRRPLSDVERAQRLAAILRINHSGKD